MVALDYSSPGGPPRLAEPHQQAGAITAVARMPAAAWLTRLAATSESAPFAEVTLVALGGSRRRQAARCAAVLAIAVALTGVATLWGRGAEPAPYPAATVIALLGMHLAEACAGIGIGVLIAPPLRTRVGTAPPAGPADAPAPGPERNRHGGTLVTQVKACSGVGETPSRR